MAIAEQKGCDGVVNRDNSLLILIALNKLYDESAVEPIGEF
jgi:hypothetical protein